MFTGFFNSYPSSLEYHGKLLCRLEIPGGIIRKRQFADIGPGEINCSFVMDFEYYLKAGVSKFFKLYAFFIFYLQICRAFKQNMRFFRSKSLPQKCQTYL